METNQPRALVIESDSERARDLMSALASLNVDAQQAQSANDGWQVFARYRPTHVFAALCCEGGAGGEQFLRKLNSDFIGNMPKVYLCGSAEDLMQLSGSDPTAFIIWPLAKPVLARLFDDRASMGDTQGRQVARLRELYELSLLGPDLIREIDFVTTRATLGFQVSNCLVWGPEEEAHWPRSTQSVPPSEWPGLRAQCVLAMRTGTTIIVSEGPAEGTVHQGGGRSLLAAPLGPAAEEPVAGICLVSSDSRRLSLEVRESLHILARRLSSELAWMSAHNRLVDEHEKLRQTALIDPLLGVWTRAALAQSIDNMMASERDRGRSLAVMLIDYKQLRAVNDHFGHSIGDAVLSHFATVARKGLRDQDQVGRFAGDELVVLLVGADLPRATDIAHEVVAKVAANPFVDGDVHIRMEASVGLTIIASDEINSDAALARAQLALDTANRTRSSVTAIDATSEAGALDVAPGHGDLFSAGSTLGGMYRILHEISRGAMGVVYRGEDLGLGRPVAIKVLRSDLSSDEGLVAQFRSEAALLASIRHRNLVQVFSFGSEGDAVYFVMELVEGEPLSTIVRRLGQEGLYLDLDAVAKIVTEIADALDAIHTLGIVHRDVKPENVLVDRINDRAVLVDVGIAKRQGDARDAAGTPGYAAPESFMEADESPPTDVYGLAATTYALLTGSPPYEGDDLSVVVNCQLNEPATPPTHFRNDLSVAVDAVLATALAPNPARRYRSANAFAIALTQALTRSGTLSTSPRSKTKTIPAPFLRPPTQRDAPPSTYRVVPLAPADSQTGQSRGAIFRVTSMVFARELGAQWVQELAQDEPEFGVLLKSSLPPQSWHSTAALVRLLDCANGHSEDPRRLARTIGSALCASTLARFYGAAPKSQSASSLIKAAESYWRRYHSWGKLIVHNSSRDEALVELDNGPDSELFCEMLAGFLGKIPALAGAANPKCVISACVPRGDKQCTYTVQWTPSTQR